jgi:hypothetical protein
MCKHVQMFPHTVVPPRENKSPFHRRQWVCCLKSVARLTRCPRPRLVQPSRGRGPSIVCICGWPNIKALERNPILSWTTEYCIQRCYWHYSKCSGFLERVMTTHVAFNRSCSFLRILSSDEIRTRRLTYLCLKFHVNILFQLFRH